MTGATLTALAGSFVTLLALVALPLYLHKQTQKQRAADKAADAKEKEEKEKKEEADRQAVAAAAAAANEAVSWADMNRTLATNSREERSEHRQEMLDQRTAFVEEIERLRKITDEELGRRDTQIRRLDDEIRMLKHQLTGVTTEMARPGGNGT